MTAGKHAAGRAPLRVLVVDDHRDTADSMAMLARLWGHEVRVAYDGASALDSAAAFRPDVLLVDLGMPGMDGARLARAVRQRPELKSARLVAVTGHADQAARDRTREAGFDFFLAKPAQPEIVRDLLAELQRVVRLAGDARDLARRTQDLLSESFRVPA